MPYVVGVSSGAFAVVRPEEKPELVGLHRKALASITKGVTFVQLDLESISEFEEPRLKEKMEEDVVKKLGIRFGIHSETKAFGVEAAELDSAIGMEYERAHKRFIDILKRSGDLGAKYLLIHSTESDPFPLLAFRTQPLDLVDFYGRSLADFLMEKEQEWLRHWLIGGKPEDVGKRVLEVWKKMRMELTVEAVEDAMKASEFIWMELLRTKLSAWVRDRILRYVWGVMLREKVEEYERLPERAKKEIDERLSRELPEWLKDAVGDFLGWIRSKGLHYGPERIAYYIIAKYMEETKDPLWSKIINASIEFLARREKKTREEWLEEKGIKPTELSVDFDAFRTVHEIWVPAVSAKYLWGHFNPKPEEPKFEDPKPLIKKYKMPIVLETPMAPRGIEEWLRLPNPVQWYHLCLEIGREYVQMAFDIEHMLSLRLDPELVIECLPQEAGKLVKVIHAGWPATLAPAHLPIKIGSNQQYYLYKVYFKLRQKGFGIDPRIEHYIVFERGAPETFLESVTALKLIAKFLEKNIKPEELPLEFYGIALEEIGAYERQLAIIREHAFDPLKPPKPPKEGG
jgi:hypothetical protein